MRNLLKHVRRLDYDAVRAAAQAIYRAKDRSHAEAAFGSFRRRWEKFYPRLVQRLGTDLPELLSFFQFPRHLWRNMPDHQHD